MNELNKSDWRHRLQQVALLAGVALVGVNMAVLSSPDLSQRTAKALSSAVSVNFQGARDMISRHEKKVSLKETATPDEFDMQRIRLKEARDLVVNTNPTQEIKRLMTEVESEIKANSDSYRAKGQIYMDIFGDGLAPQTRQKVDQVLSLYAESQKTAAVKYYSGVSARFDTILGVDQKIVSKKISRPY